MTSPAHNGLVGCSKTSEYIILLLYEINQNLNQMLTHRTYSYIKETVKESSTIVLFFLFMTCWPAVLIILNLFSFWINFFESNGLYMIFVDFIQ